MQELEQYGVTNIVTFDAHDPRVANSIPLIGFENVMPTYQMIKALTRTGKGIDEATIKEFIEGLDVSEAVKAQLRAITPHTYTGI